ncbi:RNA polymerase II mediator complex subunit [Varicellaria rhodocarpa]|nr:RNA polymerase II mediator complex subunit [Varicellaria rhodocarpa]
MAGLYSLYEIMTFANSMLFMLSIVLLYCLIGAVRNTWFHPLSRFPGPKLWSASKIPYVISVATGNMVCDIHAMHLTYGDIIRIAPDELSFTKQEAFHDIYANRSGHRKFNKNPEYYLPPPGQAHDIVTTPSNVDHARIRKVLLPTFTDRAVDSQAPIVQAYVETFVTQIRSSSQHQETQENPLPLTW